MNYPRETLLHALFVAIRVAKEDEAKLGYTRPSAYLECMEELKTALQRGENLHLTD